MAKSFMLEVVTPERKVFSEEVQGIVVPATEGYLGVLANHAPMITGLNIGVVKFTTGSGEISMAISGGFMEVVDNKVIMLVDTAELAEEIDGLRAQQAKERAEKRLQDRAADLDFNRADAALKRALARLEAKEKKQT